MLAPAQQSWPCCSGTPGKARPGSLSRSLCRPRKAFHPHVDHERWCQETKWLILAQVCRTHGPTLTPPAQEFVPSVCHHQRKLGGLAGQPLCRLLPPSPYSSDSQPPVPCSSPAQTVPTLPGRLGSDLPRVLGQRMAGSAAGCHHPLSAASRAQGLAKAEAEKEETGPWVGVYMLP